MKRFIEVNSKAGYPILINIDRIQFVRCDKDCTAVIVINIGSEDYFEVQQTYDEIRDILLDIKQDINENV